MQTETEALLEMGINEVKDKQPKSGIKIKKEKKKKSNKKKYYIVCLLNW
ncbi:MAG TPA: hypothetical protein VIJ75_09465 [Hanamia sp.]